MASTEKSLRWMVENWLAPNRAMAVRVIEFRHFRSHRGCYVRVEALRSTGSVAMFFFRHRDGTWNVFPPNPERPAMGVYLRAA
ncbi:hypothetical protein OKW42_000761 [Paraburkholderia sp. WC7.3d]|uniref:Uncharacterized protein n=1 Tax=Paraburkholderia podalyriae TaxID=1938811 RepID=A0ABR7PV78_9BURK|nr:hypothetical protein [Paraburkholderia podalyriae]